MASVPGTAGVARPRGGEAEFSIGGPTQTSWREQVLTAAAEQRFLAVWLRGHSEADPELAAEAVRVVERHLDAAERAAEGRHRGWFDRARVRFTGADMDRAAGHLDAASATIMRLAPSSYLAGQLPSVLGSVRAHLGAEDPRRQHVELLAADARDRELTERDREGLIAAFHAAQSAARREMTRVRSFRNVLLVSVVLLTLAAGLIVGLGVAEPDVIPLCFNPGDAVVCPTGERPVPGAGAEAGAAAGASALTVDDAIAAIASPWDIAVVALVGLVASALAGAAAVRGLQGTSTPYSLPVWLAVLKLPTGVLTAILGILLMRGEFIPGLSALDSPEQIVAWAIVFGYAQQILTRFLDQRAQSVLGNVRSSGQPGPAGPAKA